MWKWQRTKQWSIERLNEKAVKETFECDVESGVDAEENVSSVEEEWEMLKRARTSAGRGTFDPQKAVGRKPCMTENILQLMDEHKKYKSAKERESDINNFTNTLTMKCG